MTPAGTRPTDKTRPATSSAGGASSEDGADAHRYDSGRYTAPQGKLVEQSPSWVPILMLVFFAVGALAIMARYLWWDSNVPMVAGMVCLLAGLFTATKWR